MSEQIDGRERTFDLRTIGRSMPRERHQNGWVEKTGKKTKTWTGFWYVYVIEDGVEKRRERSKVLGKCSELTKGQAQDALVEHIRGKRPPVSGATFGQLAEWYLATNQGNWSKKWNATSRGMFDNQILPQLGAKTAAGITRSDVQQAINAIAADPKSQSTSIVKKCLTHIRAVFTLALDDEVLPKAPAIGRKKIRMPAMRKASERFLSLDEVHRLLSVSGQRDYLILRLLIVDGLRPSELFALRPNDIEPALTGEDVTKRLWDLASARPEDIEPGRLRIDQTAVPGEDVKEQGKTECSLGYVPLSSDIERELRIYISEKQLGAHEFLFPSATGTAVDHGNYLDRVLKPLGVLAAIDVYQDGNGATMSKLNHQVLRRTTATHFQKHGEVKDTQALLRHTDASTTLKHYQKTLEESLIHAVESWDSALMAKHRSRRGQTIQ